jgi:hypothetical protein
LVATLPLNTPFLVLTVIQPSIVLSSPNTTPFDEIPADFSFVTLTANEIDYESVPSPQQTVIDFATENAFGQVLATPLTRHPSSKGTENTSVIETGHVSDFERLLSSTEHGQLSAPVPVLRLIYMLM